MRRVPKKNIYSKITDIIRPGGASRAAANEEARGSGFVDDRLAERFAPQKRDMSLKVDVPLKQNMPLNRGEMQNRDAARGRDAMSVPPRRKIPVAKLTVIFLVIAFAALAAGGYYAFRTKQITLARIGKEAAQLYGALHGSGAGMPAGTGPAEEGNNGIWGAVGFGEFLSGFKLIGQNFQVIQAISNNGAELVKAAKAMEATWITNMLHGKGNEIITRLKDVQRLLALLKDENGALGKNADLASRVLPVDMGSYFDLRIDLDRITAALDHFIAWLDEDRDHHIAVFFENPAEIRPGGGFVGSYADVALRKGSVAAITMHDINDADKLLDRKIVPPLPLQPEWQAV